MMIRKAAVEDVKEIARLSEQLGYPADVEQMEVRLRAVADRNDNVVYVKKKVRRFLQENG